MHVTREGPYFLLLIVVFATLSLIGIHTRQERLDDVAIGVLNSPVKIALDDNLQKQTTALHSKSRKRKKDPLNIVLLYADDWSHETLGRVNPYVQTPVLDQLANDGVFFTHNCVVTSVCMQSRATLYTGQYSSRHQTYFAYKNVTMYEHWQDTLYPSMMKAGYYTGFYGKYHHLEAWPKEIPTFSDYKFYSDKHIVRRRGVTKHITEWNQHDGLAFLEDRPRDRPFFLTLSFFATHAEDSSPEQYKPMPSSMSLYNDTEPPMPKTYTPQHWKKLPYFFNERNVGRARFRKRYKTRELYNHMMKNTYRMATEVDTVCGVILDKLKEQGVWNQTLIIFTTDNGNLHGQHGLAEKWFPYEESIRVPLIIRDPRRPTPPGGMEVSDFTLNIDLAPTILSAAGRVPPKAMQGRDMAQLYLKSTNSNWRMEFVYEFWDDNRDIPNSRALVRKDSKYIYWSEHQYPQLFRLEDDPYEEVDVINRTDPEVINELHWQMDSTLVELKRQSTCRVHCWEELLEKRQSKNL